MIGLNAMVKCAVVSALLIFMFAACVWPSFAEGRIHISGIDPSLAFPYSAVRVYGSGAAPRATVTAMLSNPVNETFIVGNDTNPLIIVSSGNLTLGSTFADETGDWGISFLTPNVFPGHYSVYVFDSESQTSDMISFQVLMNATVVSLVPMNMTIWYSNMTSIQQGPLSFFVAGTAVPSSGPPGTLVTMLGGSASGGEISVYFDDLRVATVVGQRGAWSTSFQVPNVSVGNHTIRAVDVEGRWMSSAPFNVTSAVISFSVSSVFLFGLFAAVVLSGVILFMLLAMFCRKRK